MYTWVSTVAGKYQSECEDLRLAVIPTSLYNISIIRLHLHCLWLLNIGVYLIVFATSFQKQNKNSDTEAKKSTESLEVGPAVLINGNLIFRLLIHEPTKESWTCVKQILFFLWIFPQCSTRADILATIKSKSYGHLATVCLVLYLQIYNSCFLSQVNFFYWGDKIFLLH